MIVNNVKCTIYTCYSDTVYNVKCTIYTCYSDTIYNTLL